MDNKKGVLIAVLGVGIVAMTVAFAALSTNLRISGTASVPSTNWNIHFASWEEDTASTVTEGGVTHQNTAEYPTVSQLTQSLAPNVTLVEGLNITLYQPGDYAKYTFNIVNEGTIDASLENFTHTMTCESGKNCDFLEYTVECKDSQLNTVTNNYVLPHGQSVSCFLQLKFKDVDNLGANTNNQANNLQASIVNGVYTQEATSATLTANWSWIQRQESQAQGGGNSGGNETPVTPSNSYETTFNGTYGYDFPGAETDGNGGSSEWVSSLNPEELSYLRYTGSSIEACGVLGNGQSGTVCMTSAYYNSSYPSVDNYGADFEDVSTTTNDITTVAGLEATGLKGYSLAKAEEMLSKGASYCNVSTIDLNCYTSSNDNGYISSGGGVAYYSYDNGGGAAEVWSDGSAGLFGGVGHSAIQNN